MFQEVQMIRLLTSVLQTNLQISVAGTQFMLGAGETFLKNYVWKKRAILSTTKCAKHGTVY